MHGSSHSHICVNAEHAKKQAAVVDDVNVPSFFSLISDRPQQRPLPLPLPLPPAPCPLPPCHPATLPPCHPAIFACAESNVQPERLSSRMVVQSFTLTSTFRACAATDVAHAAYHVSARDRSAQHTHGRVPRKQPHINVCIHNRAERNGWLSAIFYVRQIRYKVHACGKNAWDQKRTYRHTYSSARL